MLSLQGFIAKKLNDQGKLPEKFKDLSGAPKTAAVFLYNAESGDESPVTGQLSWGSAYQYCFKSADGQSFDWINVPWEITIASYAVKALNGSEAEAVVKLSAGSTIKYYGLLISSINAQYRKGTNTDYEFYDYANTMNVYNYGKFSWDPETLKFTVSAKQNDENTWHTATFAKSANYSNKLIIQAPRPMYAILDTDHICLKYDGKIIYGKEFN